MTESVNTSIGKPANTTKPYTIKAGMNINQNLLLKQSATIFWDFAIHTDRKIDANKPDTTIKDHKNNSCLLVELMFPMDNNLSSGELGKISNTRTWKSK